MKPGSVLSGEAASDAGLDAMQTHYVTSYSAAELRTFHRERERKMPLSGLDPRLGFCARLRRIESTLDAEWQKYALPITCCEDTY